MCELYGELRCDAAYPLVQPVSEDLPSLGSAAAQHKEEAMGHTQSSKQVSQSASRWRLVALDIATGFMSMSRFIVTFVGCLTLLGVAAVAGNDQARARFAEQVPVMFAGWLLPAAAPEAGEGTTEPNGAAPAVASQAGLDPEQRHVTQYLSRRYRVADEAVRQLVAAAYRAGQEHTLDPLLILAVMAVESSMNPFAESPVGAQGLMQVMTRVHTDKFEVHGGDHAALDPVANIQVGSAILKDLIRRGGSIERGLQLYVGAGNLADDGGYSGRVLAERSRIQLAAHGKVDLALSAGLRADNARSEPRPLPAESASPPSGAMAPVSATVPAVRPAAKSGDAAA
jgi:hypothetical protein